MNTLVRLFTLGLVIGSLGCVRDKDPLSTMTISVPSTRAAKANKLSSQNTSQLYLQHLVVNVRKSGGEMVGVFNFDIGHDCTPGIDCPAPPEHHVFSLPRGNNYLIQILAVYVDSSEAMTFTYGDVVKNIDANQVYADITVNTIGTASGLETRFGGRFLTSASAGPTGTIVVSYQPEGGKPPMAIMEDLMFDGWFHLFSLQGAPFNYILKETGHQLFVGADPSSAATPGFTDQPHRLRIAVPDYYRQDGDPNGNSSYRLESGGGILYGFFGPHVAANSSDYKVCYTTVDGASLNYMYEDNAGATALKFDSQSPFQSPSVHPVGNGGDGSGSCMTGSEAYKLEFKHEIFEGWLGSAFGFYGPYVNQDNGDHYSPIIFSSGSDDGTMATLVGQWSYLPGVFGSSVSGTTAFLVMDHMGDQYRQDSHYRCQDLYSNSQGFSSVANMASVTRFDGAGESAAGGSTSLQMPSQWASGQGGDVILCPYSTASGARQYYSAGINSYGIHFHFPSHELTLKLVGSGVTAENQMYQQIPGLGTNDFSFMNSSIIGSTNKIYLIPFAVNNQDTRYISHSDIQLVEMTFDDGATWKDLTANCGGDLKNFNDSNGHNMMRVELSGLSSCSFVSGDWGGAGVDVKFRVTVDPDDADEYGLGDGSGNVYTTGKLSLRPDSDCTSRAIGMVKTSTPTSDIATANFMDEFFGSNGTDLQTEYQLAWTSSSTVCTDSTNGGRNILPVLSYFTYTDNLSSYCFDEKEIRLGTSTNPFALTVNPTDYTGADCDLNTNQFGLHIAGENTVSYTSTFSSGDVIQHSTVAVNLIPYLSADTGASQVGGHKLILESLFMHTGLSLGIMTAYANSDYQPVDTASPGGTPTNSDWGASGVWGAGGVLSNPTTSLTLAAGVQPGPISFSESGKIGAFQIKPHSLDEAIMYVDTKGFRGGSPLIVTKDSSSQLSINYIPGPEAGPNPSFVRLYGPVPGGSVWSRMTHYHYNGRDYIIFNDFSKLHFVALDHDNSVLSTSYRDLNSGKKLWDFRIDNDGGGDFILAVTEDGFNDGKIFHLPFSSWDGTNWTHPVANDSLIVNEAGHIMTCGGAYYLHGIWNANYSAIIPFSLSTGSIIGNSSNKSWGDATGYWFGEYDHFGCTNVSGENHFYAYKVHATAQGPSAGRYPMIFKGYQEGTATSHSQILINDANVHIDAMKYVYVSGLGTRLLVVSRPTNTANKVDVKMYIPQTGGTTYTFDSVIGSFVNDASEPINGIQEVNSDGPPQIYIYGDKGQLYILRGL